MAGETHPSVRAHVEGLLGDTGAAEDKGDGRQKGPLFMKGLSECAAPT